MDTRYMTVASIARRPVAVGLILWVVALAVVPAPLAARLWLGVPFVLVPRLAPALAVAGVRRSSTGLVAPVAAWPWLAVGAGLLAAASFVTATGSAAAGLLAAPWWLLCVGGALTSFARLRAERTWSPSVLGLARFVADAFLLGGATALLADRLAIDPMGYGAAIVLLTAVHFSVAGFGLVAVAALLAARGSAIASIAIPGLAIGMPLTALGFIVERPIAGWPGTILVALCGLLVAGALTMGDRGSRGTAAARLGAAAALAAGMILAIGWSTAQVLGIAYLDLETMIRTHGALNLLAILAAAWVLVPGSRSVPGAVRPVRETIGGGVAFAIGIPVGVVLARSDFGTLTEFPVGLAVASLVGPAVAGWLVAGRQQWPLARPVRAAMSMGMLAVLVACMVTAAIAGLSSTTTSAPFAAAGFIFILGLIVIGPIALLATVPCSVIWLAIVRRLASRWAIA